MGDRRGADRILVGKREGKRPLGKHRRRLEDNIKMYVREAVWGHGLDRAGLEQGQMAGFCEYRNEPLLSIKWGECP
jgi:hypothetical protein